MDKTETIVLILIIVVAFAGIWFLFKGPGKAVEMPILQVNEVPVSERNCVCRDSAGETHFIAAGKATSVYDCRSLCMGNSWQFVELRQ
jgi:hypothetical protein